MRACVASLFTCASGLSSALLPVRYPIKANMSFQIFFFFLSFPSAYTLLAVSVQNPINCFTIELNSLTRKGVGLSS